VGFALPQIFPEGNVSVETVRDTALKAEMFGFDSVWTQERIVGAPVILEPISLLSYLASITQRVRLGVSVFVLPQHNPVYLAKALSSLDVLSGGRVTAGVGLGGGDALNPIFGIPTGKRVSRFLESIRVIDALWTQEKATVEGQFFKLNNVELQPKPVQKPRIPLWFGARTEPALRRAVQYADGWMGPGSSSAAEFTQHVLWIKQFLDEANRDPATFPISKRVYLAIDDDSARAERRLRDWFAYTYGNADMANRVAFWGPQHIVSERIEALVEAGAQHLLLHPVFDYDEHLQALKHFVQ
jgi:probable F420-dependent oxidoreductase